MELVYGGAYLVTETTTLWRCLDRRGRAFRGRWFVKLHFDSGVGSEARSRRGDDDHPPAGTVAGQDGAGDPPKNRALTPVSHDRAA
jgi:hypothetical protein